MSPTPAVLRAAWILCTHEPRPCQECIDTSTEYIAHAQAQQLQLDVERHLGG